MQKNAKNDAKKYKKMQKKLKTCKKNKKNAKQNRKMETENACCKWSARFARAPFSHAFSVSIFLLCFAFFIFFLHVFNFFCIFLHFLTLLTFFRIDPKWLQMMYFDLLSQNFKSKPDLELIFIMKIQQFNVRPLQSDEACFAILL